MDATHKLYRSKTNRQLAGVGGGLAEYFNVDATLIPGAVRLAGRARRFGLVLYVALWIIVPRSSERAVAR